MLLKAWTGKEFARCRHGSWVTSHGCIDREWRPLRFAFPSCFPSSRGSIPSYNAVQANHTMCTYVFRLLQKTTTVLNSEHFTGAVQVRFASILAACRNVRFLAGAAKCKT